MQSSRREVKFSRSLIPAPTCASPFLHRQVKDSVCNRVHPPLMVSEPVSRLFPPRGQSRVHAGSWVLRDLSSDQLSAASCRIPQVPAPTSASCRRSPGNELMPAAPSFVRGSCRSCCRRQDLAREGLLVEDDVVWRPLGRAERSATQLAAAKHLAAGRRVDGRCESAHALC